MWCAIPSWYSTSSFYVPRVRRMVPRLEVGRAKIEQRCRLYESSDGQGKPYLESFEPEARNRGHAPACTCRANADMHPRKKRTSGVRVGKVQHGSERHSTLRVQVCEGHVFRDSIWGIACCRSDRTGGDNLGAGLRVTPKERSSECVSDAATKIKLGSCACDCFADKESTGCSSGCRRTLCTCRSSQRRHELHMTGGGNRDTVTRMVRRCKKVWAVGLREDGETGNGMREGGVSFEQQPTKFLPPRTHMSYSHIVRRGMN